MLRFFENFENFGFYGPFAKKKIILGVKNPNFEKPR